jgi:hypothetical protein
MLSNSKTPDLALLNRAIGRGDGDRSPTSKRTLKKNEEKISTSLSFTKKFEWLMNEKSIGETETVCVCALVGCCNYNPCPFCDSMLQNLTDLKYQDEQRYIWKTFAPFQISAIYNADENGSSTRTGTCLLEIPYDASDPTPKRSIIPYQAPKCKNGQTCPFLQNGTCRFTHEQVDFDSVKKQKSAVGKVIPFDPLPQHELPDYDEIIRSKLMETPTWSGPIFTDEEIATYSPRELEFFEEIERQRNVQHPSEITCRNYGGGKCIHFNRPDDNCKYNHDGDIKIYHSRKNYSRNTPRNAGQPYKKGADNAEPKQILTNSGLKKLTVSAPGKPLNNSGFQKPLNNSGSQKPLNNSGFEKPPNKSAPKKPLNNSGANKPINIRSS